MTKENFENAADNNVEVVSSDDLPEQLLVRLAKRQRLLDAGVDPYPVKVDITHSLLQVRQQFAYLQIGETTGKDVSVAGRVVFVRNTGKLCFATLQAGDGVRLQVMVSLAHIGEKSLGAWKSDVDLGDHVFVTGEVISSKRGELSVLANFWCLTAKTLRPLPTMHNKLSEESRVRQRYIDLIMRDSAREMVFKRAAVMESLRQTFKTGGFVEVETPMLQTVHGGAAARPFTTYMNAFDSELFLRIAPELFLKRAVVGGLDKVFEINRNFRNEGVDSSHSPEFAMVEAYEAYGDYESVAVLTKSLIQNAVLAVCGQLQVTLQNGVEYDFGGDWQVLDMYGSLSVALNFEVTPETSVPDLVGAAKNVGVESVGEGVSHGKLVENLWEELVGSNICEPTFVKNFPVETSPLVRQHRSVVGLVEKWDLYVRGFELATGYSELVDPVVQRERFVAQAKLAAAGDVEAMVLDEDFLVAMEHGMPPTGGIGLGVDRLLMAITGLGIRETVLFPLIKAK